MANTEEKAAERLVDAQQEVSQWALDNEADIRVALQPYPGLLVDFLRVMKEWKEASNALISR
jgi:hypothetical protein